MKTGLLILKLAFATSVAGMLVSMGLIPISKQPKKDGAGYYYERRSGEKVYSSQAEDAYRSHQFATNLGLASGCGVVGFGGYLLLLSIRERSRKYRNEK